MSEAGDLLELLHGARRSWTTVRATVREWSHRERRKQAFLRFAEDRQHAGGVVSVRGTAPHDHDPPLPDEMVWTTKVWVGPPDRVHVEHEGGVVPVRRRLAAVNGRPVSVPQDNPIQHLIDPSVLISALDFAPTGRGEVAGRPVLLVDAEPRPLPREPGPPVRGLAPGADRYVLSVDAERGVLLRVEARQGNEPFAISEVVDIAFDEDLPDDVFSAAPPEEAFPRPEAVSIEEASRRAPFVVLVPTRVPEGSTLLVRIMPPVGPRPFVVSLSYHLPAALHHLELNESAEADAQPDGVAWTEERHGGQPLWIWEPPRELVRTHRQLKVLRAGTVVRITSDLDLDFYAPSLCPWRRHRRYRRHSDNRQAGVMRALATNPTH